MTELLAIEGGTPVRATSLSTEKGASFLDHAEEEAAVLEVLRSRSLFRYEGPGLLGKAAGFEEALRRQMGSAHAVAVSSGTAALQVGLVGLEVEEGDEVVVPAVTFIATIGAVVHSRAVPVFAEVDESLNMDPASFESLITPKTRAVIPVHLMNAPCDMERIMEIAGRRGVKVLEDAAQAIGVKYRGRYVGSIGDAGAFSLQLSKNITTGEGGALVTNSFSVFDRAVRYQDQGGQFTTSHGDVRNPTAGEPFIGANLRMSEIAGAIAAVQLGRLDDLVASMRGRAQAIRARLGDVPLDWRPTVDPSGDGGDLTMYFETPEIASRFGAALRAEGIGAGRVYGGRPVYANPAVLEQRTAWRTGCPFRCTEHPTDRRYSMGMCPRSEALLGRSLTIGLGAQWTAEDEDDVVRAVRKVASVLL